MLQTLFRLAPLSECLPPRGTEIFILTVLEARSQESRCLAEPGFLTRASEGLPVVLVIPWLTQLPNFSLYLFHMAIFL